VGWRACRAWLALELTGTLWRAFVDSFIDNEEKVASSKLLPDIQD